MIRKPSGTSYLNQHHQSLYTRTDARLDHRHVPLRELGTIVAEAREIRTTHRRRLRTLLDRPFAHA